MGPHGVHMSPLASGPACSVMLCRCGPPPYVQPCMWEGCCSWVWSIRQHGVPMMAGLEPRPTVQVIKGEAYGRRSDVWSLGDTLCATPVL